MSKFAKDRILPSLVAVGLLFGISGAGISGFGVAQAGHTLPMDQFGGDCWQVGTPLWCRTSWQNAPNHDMRLKMMNQFANLEPGWSSLLDTACTNWHNYRPSVANMGDIKCDSGLPNDSLVYWKWASPPLPFGVQARTYNCTSSNACSASANQSILVWYSEVHMNRTEIRKYSNTVKTMIFAHELGHALGLGHHDGNFLMNSAPNGLTGPTATDYGSNPPCGGAFASSGVRCIYNHSN